MTAPLLVAGLQMVSRPATAPGALRHNLSIAQQQVATAAQKGAELVVLAENFLVFADSQRYSQQAQCEWLLALAALAKRYQLWLVAGSLPLSYFDWRPNDRVDELRWSNRSGDEIGSAQNKPYATCVVFNSEGAIAGVYRKMHLFDVSVAHSQVGNEQVGNEQVGDDQVGESAASTSVSAKATTAHSSETPTRQSYRESDQFQHGDEPALVETPWGRLGLAICYDLRFPEYFRHLALEGADFFALPSAFTYTTGRSHWEILCRARAIETQSFFIAVNQGGEHSVNRKTWGDSMIVDAWGRVLSRAGSESTTTRSDAQLGETLVLATFDREAQQIMRRDMPIAEHRRL